MSGPSTRRRGDRGVAIVELALVVPVLALLAFATIEVTLAWTAENRVQSAVAQGARVGASSGQEREADRDMLYALKASLSNDALARLDRVVIFNASSVDGQVPAACVKAPGSTDETGVSNVCNTYTGATVRSLSSTNEGTWFSGTCASPRKDRFWCPTTRVDTLAAAGGPQWLGVWIRTSHTNAMRFFFQDFTLERSAVFRIQPDYTG